MAVTLVDEMAIKEDLNGRALKDIYVKVEFVDGDQKFVPLTKIKNHDDKFLFDEIETVNRASTFKKFVSSPSGWLIDGKAIRKVASKTPVIATTIVSNSLDNPSAYGMKQMLSLTKNDAPTYGETTKLFVKLEGDNDFVLADAKSIYVFKDGVSRLLSQLSETELADINNANLYYNNRKILTLDQGKFDDNVIEQEQVTVTPDGYKLHSFEIDEDNMIKTDEKSLADTVTTQTYGVDEKLGRFTENRKYELDVSRQGGQIYVVDSTGNKMLVDIKNLYEGSTTSPRQIDVKKFKKQPNNADVNNSCLYFVGKKLLLKVKDSYIELQPLTADQVIKVFANNTRYATPTTDKSEIMADGVFRITKDGRFVEEKSLSPICYDYASDSATDFTAYLFEFELEGAKHHVVLDKTKFGDDPTTNITYEGRNVTLSLNGAKQPRKLNRVNKTVADCAVVQTTNTLTAKYNSVEIIRNDINDRGLSDEEKERAEQAQAKFVADYKSGEYVLTNVYDGDGNLVEFSERTERYKMEDNYRIINSTNLKSAEMTLVKGKFKGDATFDAKKANKMYSKSAVDVSVNTFKLMFSNLGLISMLAFPVLPVVAVGSLVSIPVASIVNRIHQVVSKQTIANVKAPTDNACVNKIVDLKRIYELAYQTEKLWQEEETKSIRKDKKLKRAHTRAVLTDDQVYTFLVNMSELEKQMDLVFADRTTTESFTVVNGKATITPENAYLAKRYEEKVKDTQKQIDALKKRLKKTKGAQKSSLQAQLDVLTGEYEHMTNGTYTMTYASVKGNEKARETAMEHFDFVKGYVLTKYKDYDDLTSAEKELLDKIKVDLENGTIKYKHKHTYKRVSLENLKNNAECSAIVNMILEKGKFAEAELIATDGKVLGRVENPEFVEEEVPLDEKSLIAALIKKLSKDESVSDEIENFADVLKRFKKTDFNAEDLTEIEKYFENLEQEFNKLSENINQKTENLENNSDADKKTLEDIEKYITQLKGLDESLNNCNKQIENLDKLLSGNLNDDQKEKVKASIEKFKKMSENITANANKLAELVIVRIEELKLKGLSEEDRERLIKMRELLKSGWQNTFFSQVEDVIKSIDELLSKTGFNDKTYNDLVATVSKSETYGVKTKILDNIKNYKDVLSGVKEQYSKIEESKKTLEMVILTVDSTDDADLKKVKTVAEDKIKQLNARKALLNSAETTVNGYLDKYNNLKLYWDVKAVEKNAKDIIDNKPLFKTNLKANKTGVAFLGKVIDTIIKLEKQQNVIESDQIWVNEEIAKDLTSLKTELPNILKELKKFVDENYSILNDCADDKVKEKYAPYLIRNDYDVKFKANGDDRFNVN